jgi:hypothetical protein
MKTPLGVVRFVAPKPLASNRTRADLRCSLLDAPLT